MQRITLASIHRYPLKGFGAQVLQDAELQVGRGLAFDRAWAITNAERALAAHGAWTPCQAFVRLTKNIHLPLFDVQFDEQALQLKLMHRDGRSLDVDLSSSVSMERANLILAQWLPATSSQTGLLPQLAAASRETGYWDHSDATLSIIHLPSVAQLSAAAGMGLDARRFRGNLLIDGGMAWQELQWLGHRVRIGAVELEVLRPIDRCVATSVNPLTAEKDVNLPALLARHAGHVFCGVYARVVQAGRIAQGDELEVLQSRKGIMQRASKVTTAPPVAQWPRAGKVAEVVHESESVQSFWIQDSAAEDGLQVPLQAGQHVRLHAIGEGAQLWRSYTVSANEPDGRFRISIKREPRAGASDWLHTYLKAGKKIVFSGPFGGFTLPERITQPLFFLSAGIGITPLHAMLREWVKRPDKTASLWIHSARSERELALWHETVALAKTWPQVELRLHLTDETSETITTSSIEHNAGLVDWQKLSALARQRNAQVFMCGPEGFMQAGLKHLQQANVPSAQIHFERFASPRTDTQIQEKPKLQGPFKVGFQRSGLHVSWTAQSGSLLELAEQHGLSLPANCRSGACGACQQQVLAGEVLHLSEPVLGLATGQALLCCTVPVTDLVLDI